MGQVRAKHGPRTGQPWAKGGPRVGQGWAKGGPRLGARLGQYSGEKFKVTGARADGDKGTIVDSNILRDPQPAVRVQWRVRQRDGHLKIVDVVVEGVSMAVTQRSEFASVIRKRGGQVSGLIEDLRAKLTTLEH